MVDRQNKVPYSYTAFTGKALTHQVRELGIPSGKLAGEQRRNEKRSEPTMDKKNDLSMGKHKKWREPGTG